MKRKPNRQNTTMRIKSQKRHTKRMENVLPPQSKPTSIPVTTTKSNNKEDPSITTFLHRLSSVASQSYPFSKPNSSIPIQRQSVDNRYTTTITTAVINTKTRTKHHENSTNTQLNLLSYQNLSPALTSVLHFFLSTFSPFLSILFLSCYTCCALLTTTTSNNGDVSSLTTTTLMKQPIPSSSLLDCWLLVGCVMVVVGSSSTLVFSFESGIVTPSNKKRIGGILTTIVFVWRILFTVSNLVNGTNLEEKEEGERKEQGVFAIRSNIIRSWYPTITTIKVLDITYMDGILWLGLAFGLRSVLIPNPFLHHFFTNGRWSVSSNPSSSDTTTNTTRKHHNDNTDNTTTTNRFYCQSNPINNHITSMLRSKGYLSYRPTPYLFSGDLLTIMPFLLFQRRGVQYDRWWVRVPAAPAPDGENPIKGLCRCRFQPGRWRMSDDDDPNKRTKKGNLNDGLGGRNGDKDDDDDDDEAVALDISFPTKRPTLNKDSAQPQPQQQLQRYHDPTKPFYLILHGLNGGSNAPFVLDLVDAANEKGCTAAVMISRGSMNTPVRGRHLFHGARTTDVGCVVRALRYALSTCNTTTTNIDGIDKNSNERSNIVLVGFSMGGFVALNYAAKSRSYHNLAGVVSFSASICSSRGLPTHTPSSVHSRRIWQPPVAWRLKQTIIRPSMSLIHRHTSLTPSCIERNVRTLLDIDRLVVAPYHGYPNLEEYYADMSAGGRGDGAGLEKLCGVVVPTLAVHARDDPIAPFETCMREDEIERTERVVVLATVHGGHIGWPRGWWPRKDRWGYMMGLVLDYGEVVVGLNSGGVGVGKKER